MDLGQQLDSVKIQTGLRQLNKDIAFDVVANRPSEWNYVLVLADPRYREAIEKKRMPVLYREQYIVSMDRGMVAEVKTWELTEKVQEVPAAPMADEAFYSRTAPGDSKYRAQYDKAMAGDPSYQLDSAGLVTRWWHWRKVKVRGRVLTLGWRHTFEALLKAEIPGITRASLSEKFAVDMYKIPEGPVGEVVAALTEE